MILVTGGIKGGCGKSSLVTHLATLAASEGSKVLIVDADHHGSLSDWANVRNGQSDLPEVTTVSMHGNKIGAEITRLSPNFDVTIVDTDGADGSAQRSAILIADVFLTPFQPRPQDLWTVDKVAELVRGARTINTTLRSITVLNRCPARSPVADALEALAEYADTLEIAPVHICDRTSLGSTFQFGQGVCELKKKDTKALAEIAALWTFIKG